VHDVDLVVTLAVALSAALVLGYLTQRLRLSPIVGYLLAGVVIGPHTPGFAADPLLARQLAEIGVVLLMFGVGLHLHFRDLLRVRRTALTGAVVTCALATALAASFAVSMGWALGPALVLGAGVSVASTVVLVRGLMDAGRLDTAAGHVAVGWLVVEDLLTVLLLVVLPEVVGSARGGAASAVAAGALAVGKLAMFATVVLVVGGRAIPWLMAAVARTRSRELFTLTVLVVALAVATLAATLFGVSMALGAFLAGLVVGRSKVSHQAAADALPLRDAFAVLFFVSVGMLFDPGFVVRHPGLVAGLLGVILLAKPLTALAILALRGWSSSAALTVAVGLAQIGEFSFILAELARRLGVLPVEGHHVLVTCSLLSITANPLLFRALPALEGWVRRRPALRRLLDAGAERRLAHVPRIAPDRPLAIVVGHGPVGQTVRRILGDFGLHPVIVELNVDTVRQLSKAGHPAVYGDASRRDVLRAAGAERARFVIVTLPDLPSRIPVILAARELSPDARILVRARYLAERSFLEELGVTVVCYEEAEAAVGLAEIVLREVGADEERVASETRKIRDELAIRPDGGAG
jgi:CPA2 family monovalent cation:H+ antiporter-2